MWGYFHEQRVTAPLITALEHDRTPRPLKGFRKPALVPGSPLLQDAQPSAEDFAERLLKWAHDWGTD